ncbi:MAG TPA: response regulator [Vicinamibacterales bacterium]|jgi:twitching motility two-component system response regulator PilH|nr:response regulator [Vicinamibacterales bacterium]
MTQAAAATDTNEERAPRRGAILVVEDRDDVRLGLAQLLEYHGYVVTDAGDGETALGRLHSSPDNIALILLDLMLPGAVGGRDIRARQLADPQLADIPAVVITATEPPPDERAGLHADGWLDKPFRFEDLLSIVKRYVVAETGDTLDL